MQTSLKDEQDAPRAQGDLQGNEVKQLIPLKANGPALEVAQGGRKRAKKSEREHDGDFEPQEDKKTSKKGEIFSG